MTVALSPHKSVLKRTLAGGLGLLAIGAFSATPVLAQSATSAQSRTTVEQNAPAATLQFAGGDVAAGIGFSWANGTVDYRGVHHRFHVNGISVADVGVVKITAVGEVYNLHNLADLDGTYAAVSAGATLGGGGGLAYLRNQHGVVIKIASISRGINVQLAADGMRIKLES